ncbi:hypothetical protein CAOG_03090 [Capsaspora owczarzaki ATCC 30864]|uniref:Right handed beta helix domain-containing protein n=1 Tax=Capsaspora owczarzaki (strain ATCC 30864) TaxID=595528 RepID=A0A0D2WNQ3_CAPO3|nr:hypothetical protein CAOG_03090 [Capsaspora owczarzaki ATCC 30864]KJE92063.1 hypothetical protein CAOG_003090 [Capsaspora owczarzaki ATCC 30864]|eukprot:XP_004363929.2 hypothetical protein CAOG_03090 [Capsaspora owczarzaki ATCC 30864]
MQRQSSLLLLLLALAVSAQAQACDVTVGNTGDLALQLTAGSTAAVVCLQTGTYAFSNSQTVARSLTLRGTGITADNVVISSTGNNVFVVNSGLTVNFEKLRINGARTCINLANTAQSTMFDITLNNCDSVVSQGGGIHLVSNNVISISNSRISNSLAPSVGGAIQVGASCSVQVTNVTFTNNEATYSSSASIGGAIGIAGNSASITITSSTFSGNKAYNGGAIGTVNGVAGTQLSISKSTFTSNICSPSNFATGHALYLGCSSTTRTVVYDTSFIGNVVKPGAFSGSIATPNVNGQTPMLLMYKVLASGQASPDALYPNYDVYFGSDQTFVVIWSTTDETSFNDFGTTANYKDANAAPATEIFSSTEVSASTHLPLSSVPHSSSIVALSSATPAVSSSAAGPSGSPASGSSASIVPIIAGVVGALVLLVLILVIALRRRRHSRKPRVDDDFQATALQFNPLANRHAPSTSGDKAYDILQQQRTSNYDDLVAVRNQKAAEVANPLYDDLQSHYASPKESNYAAIDQRSGSSYAEPGRKEESHYDDTSNYSQPKAPGSNYSDVVVGRRDERLSSESAASSHPGPTYAAPDLQPGHYAALELDTPTGYV